MMRIARTTTGRALQPALQPTGSLTRSATELRVSPVTKMQQEKKSGEGHKRLFGNGKNFTIASLRRGPKQQHNLLVMAASSACGSVPGTIACC
jgi:hypothetical protein